MKTISTKSLKLADVPDPGRSISKIKEFALTYNWDENGDKILPYTIDSEFEALTVLSWKLRRGRWFGSVG